MGKLHAERQNDSQAAIHGLARALVFNAVEGVTNGWKKELDVVGIGYRVELKGKNMVVFTLGYSHPIEFPLPTGIDVAIDPKQTHVTVFGDRPAKRWARWRPICDRCASPTRTRTRVSGTRMRS